MRGSMLNTLTLRYPSRKSNLSLNQVTEVATQNLHHKHEEICF
jgi:hypothetical protein